MKEFLHSNFITKPEQTRDDEIIVLNDTEDEDGGACSLRDDSEAGLPVDKDDDSDDQTEIHLLEMNSFQENHLDMRQVNVSGSTPAVNSWLSQAQGSHHGGLSPANVFRRACSTSTKIEE